MRRLVSAFLQARRKRGFTAFSRRCLDVEAAQSTLLERLVARNGRTALARRLGADSVRTLADLRRLPLTDYDAIQTELEAALAGRPDQLVAGRPGFFGMTSGTTGYAKYIPIDEAFRAEFQSTVQHFLYGVVRDHPRALDHKALYMVAPAVMQTTPGGEPAGAITGFNFRRLPALLRRFYAVPADAFEVRVPERALYTVARFALAAELSIAFAVTPAPLALLGAVIERHFEALLADLHDGTLAREGLSDALHRSLTMGLRPDPARARTLAARAARARPTPEHLYPELAVICCWAHAGAETHVAPMRATWGAHVPIRHAIYSATEGWMNVPLSDAHPSGVLAADAIVIEFIDAHGVPRFAHELSEPGRYEIVLTSGAGLWRYRLGDEVEVTGFHADSTLDSARSGRGRPAPLFHFIQKTGNVLSIAHDMTTEAHVRRAVEETLPRGRRWVFGPDASGDRYRVVLEGAPDPDLPRLAAALDAALARANMGYADFRGDGLIAPIVLDLRSAAAFDAWEAARRTATVSQAKPTVFVKSPGDLPA